MRVFRPLPPHDRVIINPGNATPLTLDVGDPRLPPLLSLTATAAASSRSLSSPGGSIAECGEGDRLHPAVPGNRARLCRLDCGR